MPVLPIRFAAEVFLEHRGFCVFHAYRRHELTERHHYIYSLSAEDDDLQWQFDMRDFPDGEELPDDVAARIEAAIDRCLDGGEDFPFAAGLAPLPDALSILLVAYPFWGRDVVGLATFDIMLWGVLLGGLWALHRNPGLLRIALGLALAAFAATVATYPFPGREAVLVSCLLDLTLLVFVTVIILSYVVEKGRVDANRVPGEDARGTRLQEDGDWRPVLSRQGRCMGNEYGENALCLVRGRSAVRRLPR